jgi:hypothetical protein
MTPVAGGRFVQVWISLCGHCGRVVIAKNIREELVDDLFCRVVEWAMELVFARVQSRVDFLR